MPLSQSLLRLTSPLVNPVSKVIPTVKHINFAALLIALLLLALEKFILGVPVAMAVLAGLLGVVKPSVKFCFSPL
ncbi:integral membrane protein [Actinobacillus equuli]|nr:integral membrane protein [Actinobacillus equuli]